MRHDQEHDQRRRRPGADAARQRPRGLLHREQAGEGQSRDQGRLQRRDLSVRLRSEQSGVPRQSQALRAAIRGLLRERRALRVEGGDRRRHVRDRRRQALCVRWPAQPAELDARLRREHQDGRCVLGERDQGLVLAAAELQALHVQGPRLQDRRRARRDLCPAQGRGHAQSAGGQVRISSRVGALSYLPRFGQSSSSSRMRITRVRLPSPYFSIWNRIG